MRKPLCSSRGVWLPEGHSPPLPRWIALHHLCLSTPPPLPAPQNKASSCRRGRWPSCCCGQGSAGLAWPLWAQSSRGRVAGERGKVITTTDGRSMTLHGRAIIY